MYLAGSNLMTSAIVRVKGNNGNFITARSLLDSCSTVNLVTVDLVELLNLPTKTCSVSIGAIDNLHIHAERYAQLTFNSIHNDYQKTLKFLIVPKIADRVPNKKFPRERLDIPSNIKLADPQFDLPRPVKMLISAGTSLSMMCVGQIRLAEKNESDLILQKTQLGWIIAGGFESSFDKTFKSCHVTQLDTLLENFWKIEDLTTSSTFSSEELACENHYVKNTTREASGRYVVRLPFRSGAPDLGDSRAQALKRFYALEKKLNANIQLKHEYDKVMQEYIDLGHMVLIEDESPEGYYLPHHPVIKSSSDTTRVRIVFDASAKSSNGNSLNDLLMVGPTIQNNVFEQLLKLRTHKYILTADIEKMYRQVIMHPDDRKYLRVFWYHNGKIRAFEMTVVTFGVSSASFLSIRTLQQLATDEAVNFPRASTILSRDMYVDDLGTGGNSLAEILCIRDEIISLLKKGGFNIRQWASNHEGALNGITKHFSDLNWAIKGNPILKTLGVIWNSRHDRLTYATNKINLSLKATKRLLLSEISKIFDPLGLLGPVVLYAKVLVQDCWRAKLDWDESLPQDLHTRWVTFAGQLHELSEIKFERHILIDNPVKIEIHGFCDACLYGYGACIYVLSIDRKGNREVRLVCAKSKVAPVEGATIPRLELCAAAMLAKLYKVTCSNFNFKIDRSICWSDSMIVLAWLKKQPGQLKIFEANRVTKIRELDDIVEWRHVRSADNPADALSRGQLPVDFLKNLLWTKGPSWLSQLEETWPNETEAAGFESTEIANSCCLLSAYSDIDLFSRFSSYRLLVRVIARVLRWRQPKNKRSDPITVDEVEEAEKKVLLIVQKKSFPIERECLLASRDTESGENKISRRKTRLHNLNPFIGNDGLLRVGGRLKNANISYDQKYPILLPTNNHVTDLIIRNAHTSMFHSGIQTTLYTIRHKFWILNGKNQVRRIIRKCIECIRERPSPLHAQMATLPKTRVTNAPAFYNVGIDFFGPLYLKERKNRNRTFIKAYGCVFVCMATKAVHIELASDLTTAGFLSAFQRFSSRRGIPRHVFTDNGLNFVGANNQLKELYQLFNSESHAEAIKTFALDEHIEWHFNPPLSPHFGGLWEAAVKSLKHHVKRVLKDQKLTFEDMNTLLIRIEAILNSRPLCTLSADPNDPLVISPAHLLIGRPMKCLPERNLTMIPDNRLSSWNFITKATQDFWNRWYSEYLHELQLRQKWNDSNGRIEPGSVVLIIDKNVPTARWPLGIVLEVCPGSDGVARVANIKTATGIYKRNITCLCPLPTS